MNAKTLTRIRRWLSVVALFSILSTFVVGIPAASASYTGADAVKAGVSWAKDAVDAACEKGIIDCELADAGLKTIVNRAVGYQMLAAGFDVISESAMSPFGDVGGKWWEAAANTAYTLGWTSGVSTGKFGGSSDMTREQMAVAAAKVLGLESCDATVLNAYTDKASIDIWAKDAMACMVENKLMGQGEGVTQLNPLKGAIKAEVIVILNAQVDYADTEELDVILIAAERADVELDVMQEALDTGMNVVDGVLVAVEVIPVDDVPVDDVPVDDVPVDDIPVDTVPVAGAIAVSLAPDSPASKTINPGANGVPIAMFTFSGAGTIDTITFKRTGGGASTDFSAVSLYKGATRLKAGKTISADTNTVDFAGLNLVVADGAPVTLTLKGDLTIAAAAASTHQFTIENAAAVKSNATGVTGVPVTSNLMTVGGAVVQTITIAPANVLSKPTLGQKQVEVSNFKLTAGTNDINFSSITLTHGGTITRSFLSNLKLTDSADTTVALATVATMDSDLLVLTLATPYKIPKNNNRSFRIWGDILGGKTTDTLDFYLDESTDLVAVDSTVGYGARVTNTMTKVLVTDTTFQGGKITLADNGPVAQNVAINTTNVHLFDFSLTSDRNVTIKDYYVWLEQTAFDNKTGSFQAGTGAGTDGATIDLDAGAITTAGVVTFQTDADDNALILNDVVKLTLTTVTAGTAGTYYAKVTTAAPADTSAADVTATLVYPTSVAVALAWADEAASNDYIEVFDHDLISKVKNVKLVDNGANGTLASVATSTYLNAFSDDFDLTSATAKSLSVLVDLDSSLVAGNTIKAGVDFAEASMIKDPDANEFIATSDVVGGNTFGKGMSIVAASLTVDRASTPVSETHVKGQKGVNALGLAVKAGDGVDVKITKVTLRLVADDDGTFDNSGYGDTAANTIIDTVSLYKVNADNSETRISGPVGMSLVGTIGAAAGYYKAEFNSLGYTLAKSISEKWLVKVDLKNTISATRYFGVDLILNGATANDIEAQDKDGNTVLAAQTSGASATGPNNLATGNPTVLKTVATGGTLVGVQEGSPDASVAVAGVTGVTVGKYKFTSATEASTITKLDVVGTTTNSTAFNGTPASFTAGNNVIRVGLSYPKKDGTTETMYANMASGKASFTNLNFYVAKDQSATITILADINTIDLGAVSGTSFRLGLNELATVDTNSFESIGEGSSEKKDATSVSTMGNSTGINPVVVRKTVPTVAKLASAATKLNSGQNDIAAITIAADAKEAVSLKRFAFEYNSTATITVNNFELYRKIGTGSETSVTSNVSIRNRRGINLKSGGTAMSANLVTTDTVYVTWDKTLTLGKATAEETVAKGATNTYLVRTNVAGAAANTSISTYLADDTTRLGSTANASNTAVGGIDELVSLTGATTASDANASVANTRVIWRWLFDGTSCPYAVATNGCAFIDVGGDGAFTQANDPILYLSIGATGAAGVTAYSSSAAFGAPFLVSGSIIPGTLRFENSVDLDSVLSAASVAGVYFDLPGGTAGTYTAGSDFGMPLSTTSVTGSTASLTTLNNAVVGNLLYYSAAAGSTGGTAGVYIDVLGDTGVGAFSATGDFTIVGSTTGGLGLVNAPTSAPANNTEMFTSSANFIWSDNSATSHATTTNDWTNGVDIPSLPTSTVSLSF